VLHHYVGKRNLQYLIIPLSENRAGLERRKYAATSLTDVSGGKLSAIIRLYSKTCPEFKLRIEYEAVRFVPPKQCQVADGNDGTLIKTRNYPQQRTYI
jgi:hypothetical protein